MTLRHDFVHHIPQQLENGVLYISLEFGTIVHKCACGCQKEVVTPLSPTDWSFTFNGESITLYPSIGNWNFECKSHYWVKGSRVVWAEHWDSKKIRNARQEDLVQKQKHYGSTPDIQVKKKKKRWWVAFRDYFLKE